MLAFGLTGALPTFQSVMNYDLSPVLRRCAVVFFDDIQVYSATLEAHIQHLKEVLKLLQKHQWQVKGSKCAFAQRHIAYLGYVIDSNGVSTDPEKLLLFRSGMCLLTAKNCVGFWGSLDITASLSSTMG